MNTVVVGAYWGDEGKGKIVDLLASDADWVVRFNGGDNAGHTIVVDGRKVVLHILPSGILRGKSVAIGPDVFFNPASFTNDLEEVRSKGFVPGRILIDERAHLIMPYHIALDRGKEQGSARIGTTQRGIGPVAKDRASRTEDICVSDLLSGFAGKVKSVVDAKKDELSGCGVFGDASPESYAQGIIDEYSRYAGFLKPFVGSVAYELAESDNVLLEGAQGVLLDIVHGTRPFVTSSNTTAGGAFANLGLSPSEFRVLGIAKAYPTRVGDGPFVTELRDELGSSIQRDGQEFGATTGRPRRPGMPDFVALKYSAMVSAIDEWLVTKIDVLAGKRFTAAVAYEKDGLVSERFPFRLEGWKPVYNDKTYFFEPLGKEDVRRLVRNGYESLPEGMKDFFRDLVRFTGVPISMVSLSPERDDTVVKDVLDSTRWYLHGS